MNQATWDQVELSVGQLAARSGVAVSALHFYERQQLITSRRTTGNQRRYRRDMLRRIALIRIAQRAGVPLAEVRDVLALLPGGRTPTRQDWEQISRTWQAGLDERIHYLQQLRDDFTDCVGCGCLSIDRCRLANPRDELSREGAGPRRLVGCPTGSDSAAGGSGSCDASECGPAADACGPGNAAES